MLAKEVRYPELFKRWNFGRQKQWGPSAKKYKGEDGGQERLGLKCCAMGLVCWQGKLLKAAKLDRGRCWRGHGAREERGFKAGKSQGFQPCFDKMSVPRTSSSCCHFLFLCSQGAGPTISDHGIPALSTPGGGRPGSAQGRL